MLPSSRSRCNAATVHPLRASPANLAENLGELLLLESEPSDRDPVDRTDPLNRTGMVDLIRSDRLNPTLLVAYPNEAVPSNQNMPRNPLRIKTVLN
jgi:hypothetical protein